MSQLNPDAPPGVGDQVSLNIPSNKTRDDPIEAESSSSEDESTQPVRSSPHLEIYKRQDVKRLRSSTSSLTIHTASMQPYLLPILQRLTREVLKIHKDSPQHPRIGVLTLHTREAERATRMKLEEWDALADLIICLVNVRELDLKFYDDGPIDNSPAAGPLSFLLSLRQRFFDSKSTFNGNRNSAPSTKLLHLSPQLHSPSISPFAIRFVRFIGYHALTLEDFSGLIRLGRTGPVSVNIGWREVGLSSLQDVDEERLKSMLGRSHWLSWDSAHGGGYGCHVPSSKWGSRHNQRMRDLRDSTHAAATALVRSARPFLLSIHTPKRSSFLTRPLLSALTRSTASSAAKAKYPTLLQTKPTVPFKKLKTSRERNFFSLAISPQFAAIAYEAGGGISVRGKGKIQQTFSAATPLVCHSLPRPSRPISSSSAPTSCSSPSYTLKPPPTPKRHILSLPYEILDLILYHLSSGRLSTSQHCIVMNFAEDRSTLSRNKASSREDFLRRTNCWKWESEYERVNLGLDY